MIPKSERDPARTALDPERWGTLPNDLRLRVLGAAYDLGVAPRRREAEETLLARARLRALHESGATGGANGVPDARADHDLRYRFFAADRYDLVVAGSSAAERRAYGDATDIDSERRRDYAAAVARLAPYSAHRTADRLLADGAGLAATIERFFPPDDRVGTDRRCLESISVAMRTLATTESFVRREPAVGEATSLFEATLRMRMPRLVEADARDAKRYEMLETLEPAQLLSEAAVFEDGPRRRAALLDVRPGAEASPATAGLRFADMLAHRGARGRLPGTAGGDGALAGIAESEGAIADVRALRRERWSVLTAGTRSERDASTRRIAEWNEAAVREPRRYAGSAPPCSVRAAAAATSSHHVSPTLG